MDPQPRTLRLSTPHMHGRDVAEVQRLLGVEPDPSLEWGGKTR
jgi:hypothetical protein